MAKHPLPFPITLQQRSCLRQTSICCVCQERGKPIQIHHIDENPSQRLKILLFFALIAITRHKLDGEL